MKIKVPDYYQDFSCIAGACTDTCCAGWQVDVDDRSYAYYKTVTGAFGDRLHSVMIDGKKGAEGQFRIRPDGRCPFLNEENLCDLYTALGEDALCVTCAQYPRYTTEFGSLRETGIALSCKTAAELILRGNGTPGFMEWDDPDAFPALNDIDGNRFRYLAAARQKAFEIVWDRTYEIGERMALLLYFATDLQKTMRRPKRMEAVVARYCKNYMDEALKASKTGTMSETDTDAFFLGCFNCYMRQVIIQREWVDLVETVHETLYSRKIYGQPTKNQLKIRARTAEFFENYERTYEFENLMTYFLFRYFLKGVFDGDVLTKVKMGVISTALIAQCDAAKYVLNGGGLSLQEQIETVHLYSREVEHSEENFENLCSVFSKRREFNVRNLVMISLLNGSRRD